MKNILLILMVFGSSGVFAEHETWEYYICDADNPLRSQWVMQRRIGTVANPEESREYYYFMYSSYPVPFGYIPIIKETEDEIYLLSDDNYNYSDFKEVESASLIINKKGIYIEGRIKQKNTKQPLTFTSKCKIF